MRPNTNFPMKRLEIIKIALDLFLENGYEQTKISHIMKVADLSKGGMYHYFSSKEAILDAVIKHAISEELADFSNLLASQRSVFDKLRLFLSSDALNYSDYLKKFTQFKRHPESSIVTYRVKAITAQYGIPYLQEIIEFGIKEGIFETAYPEEFSVVLYQAGEELFYNLSQLRQTDSSTKEAFISRKIAAFNQLLTLTLAINHQDSQQFYHIICESLAPISTTN